MCMARIRRIEQKTILLYQKLIFLFIAIGSGSYYTCDGYDKPKGNTWSSHHGTNHDETFLQKRREATEGIFRSDGHLHKSH
mmetsp:Transcript_22554/g.36264  ORF Transcript_22554/g.36264 Transcript_22554/m.36264 type:complete len:81 (-) Transcript_22554:406-648(-)